MSEKKTASTQFRLSERERAFLRIIGEGSLANGLKKLMHLGGYSDYTSYERNEHDKEFCLSVKMYADRKDRASTESVGDEIAKALDEIKKLISKSSFSPKKEKVE